MFMYLLLIYLFTSMKLEKGHKNYLPLVLKLCYDYVILRNRLKYYMERWIKLKKLNTIQWKIMCLVDLFCLGIILTP